MRGCQKDFEEQREDARKHLSDNVEEVWSSSVSLQKLFCPYNNTYPFAYPCLPSFLPSLPPSLPLFFLPSVPANMYKLEHCSLRQADGLQAGRGVQVAWPKGITTHLFRLGSILGFAPSLAQSQAPPVTLPNCGLSPFSNRTGTCCSSFTICFLE